MPQDRAGGRIVVATQLPLERLQKAFKPEDEMWLDKADFVELGGEGLWDLPENAVALVTDPAAIGRASSQAVPPSGWPGKLGWVHLRSTGIDGAPKWIFEAPLVTNSRGAQAIAIAEYVMSAMLDATKRPSEIRVRSRDGWRQQAQDSLFGKSLGIVGYGSIGQAVARRAMAFGMEVTGVRRGGKAGETEGVKLADLATVLASSDVLVIAAPLTPQTNKLLNASAFAQMRCGVHLINVGRGAVVDSGALLDALDSDIVSRASLDVFDPEPPPADHWVYAHPKVHLTSHCSSNAEVSNEQADVILRDNMLAFLAEREDTMLGKVDLERGY